MDKKLSVELLATAERELEEIANVHMNLVGPISARNITESIYNSIEKLEIFPEMGVVCKDKELATTGFRMLVSGNYLCFYRTIGSVIYVYHIVDGRTNYPKMFSGLLNKTKEQQ